MNNKQLHICEHEIWTTTYHVERTASDTTAWNMFTNIKCQLIDGNIFMIRKPRDTGFLPSTTLNVSCTRCYRHFPIPPHVVGNVHPLLIAYSQVFQSPQERNYTGDANHPKFETTKELD